MNSKLFYKLTSGVYDLLDVVYFRKEESSPRRAVLDAVNDGDNVLDLCTGTGSNAIKIAEQKPKAFISGIDISKDMLRVAAMKVRKSGVKNIKLYRMDATKMKFKNESFDKILLSLVLHETEPELAEKMMNEAVRVLKKDGEIIVTEWERSDDILKKAVFMPIDLFEPKPYRTFINMDLTRYFRHFGLEITEIAHCDYSKVLRLKKKGC